jgi:hypothetical protein
MYMAQGLLWVIYSYSAGEDILCCCGTKGPSLLLECILSQFNPFHTTTYFKMVNFKTSHARWGSQLRVGLRRRERERKQRPYMPSTGKKI